MARPRPTKANRARQAEATPRLTCGDAGGVEQDGTRCEKTAGYGTLHVGTGRCMHHDEEANERKQAVKAAYLAEYAKQPITARKAAKNVGVDPVTIWRMRNDDPEFDAAVIALRPFVFHSRLEAVEDAHFVRCASDRVAASEVKFFLTNHSRHRTDGGIKYVDTYRTEQTGAGGAPIQVHTTGTQVITFGGNEIEM